MLVRLPEVMAASYRSPVTMAPAPPRSFGSGYLQADVGAPGDAERLQSCLETLPPDASAEAAAAEAQAWRLAVCDYRPRVGSDRIHPVSAPAGGGGRAADRGFVVVDLTTMWAGPLAVWLLSLIGARVTRVEPSMRRDGFRALDGRGIHPGGVQRDPGRDSAMFNALHPGGGEALDLDLRAPADRAVFEDLADAADLVVDSFSGRVMPNFGYGALPTATRASVTAFGPGPRAGWVAYGTGVHASMGLGQVDAGRFSPAAVSYPDPLGGLTLALGAAAAMIGRRLGSGPTHVSTSLAGAVQPLLAERPAQWPEDRQLGPALLARATDLGLTEGRPVGGRRWAHPTTIFVPTRMCSSL